MAEIVVRGFIPTLEPFRAPSCNAYLVDDLTQRACEIHEIIPVYRYLTGLYDQDRKKFLAPNERIGGDGRPRNVQLRIRFHPVNMRLMSEPKTVEYYFYQMLDYTLNECSPKKKHVEYFNCLLGLYVTNYTRELVEKGETPDDKKIIKHLTRANFPSSWEFAWWKRHMLRQDYIDSVKTCYNNSQQDLNHIKSGFIEGVWQLEEKSRQEMFKAHILLKDSLHPCKLIVGQFVSEDAKPYDGPHLRIIQNEDVKDSFPISHMCYLNVVNEKVVEVHVRDEQAFSLVIRGSRALEFASVIDGYFRLTERFTACLCEQVQNPAILYLKRRKIHGPIKDVVATRKLTDAQTRQGCFLVRQSQLTYRLYYIDIMLPKTPIVTEICVENTDGNFKLRGDPDETAFRTFSALVSTRLTPGVEPLQIAPSDFDKTGLQLCRGAPDDGTEVPSYLEGRSLNKKYVTLEKRSMRFTFQQRVIKGTYKNRDAVFRYLQDDKLMKEFLTKMNEVQSWKCREFVPIIGVIVAPPICLVSEFMPMGPLHLYLRHHGNDLSTGDLGDAVLCLARALWYLEEKELVHGKIRCRSAFVADRSPSSFKVKLGEPGLLKYNEDDAHWIAPEYLTVMDSVAFSQKADLYALGTTMWEIFNRGKDPCHLVPFEEVKQFYGSGKKLPLADVPQEFCAIIADCWHWDPDKRRQPQVIVRDIHQLLYQIYQPRKVNAYDDIVSQRSVRQASNSSGAPPLPPLRTFTSSSNCPRMDAQLSASTSQFSEAGRNSWMKIKLFKFFRSRRNKKYDALSNLSSYAPSVQAIPELPEQLPESIDESDDELQVDDVAEDEDEAARWNIQRKDIKLEEPLGQGFFGMVFKAKLTRAADADVETVAVKRMKSSVADYCYKDLEREIGIMKKLRHPNITKIVGIVDEEEILLVMEYLELGSLLVYLQCNEGKLSNTQLIKYSYDVVSAMSYLERKRIVHRDLAARNILVKSESCVKLSDFGLAHFVSKDYYIIQTMHRNLPIKWYAPESIMYGKFSVKSDVWSYGVALWEMFSFGKDPLLSDCDNPVNYGDKLLAGSRLPCPVDCPPDVYQIMRNCWRPDHSLRPSFSSLRCSILLLMKSTG